MSANELREAAERRRNPYPRASVSGGKDYEAYYVHQQEWADLNKLADAYCDEHPPDDDTPADDEWLYGATRGTVWLLKWNVETREVFLGETSCGVKKTKGQWRELLRALGVSIREQP